MPSIYTAVPLFHALPEIAQEAPVYAMSNIALTARGLLLPTRKAISREVRAGLAEGWVMSKYDKDV